MASWEPPTPVRNISSSRPALRIAWTTPWAMSSSCVYTASICFSAWRMFSITFRPWSGLKSPGWDATISMPPSGHFFLSSSLKPLVRSSVTEMPARPWISTTLPLHFSSSAM